MKIKSKKNKIFNNDNNNINYNNNKLDNKKAKYNKSKRKIKYIDKEFQGKFILSYVEVITISIGLSLLITLIYTYFTTSLSANNFKVIFMKVVNGKPQIISLFRMLFPIIILSGLITTFIGIIMGLLYSHKIAGPIYRFKKSLKLILEEKENEYISFKVRKNDEFKELSELLQQFYEKYKKINNELKNK